MITFSYCLDAAGNLIKLALGEHPRALIPGAVSMATSAEELSYPLPWTTTTTDAVKEVRFVPHPHVKGTTAANLHSTGEVPKSSYVFVPPCEKFASDEQVEELINLYDKLPVGDEGREQITEGLAAVGIQQIPHIPTFTPELHEGDSSMGVTKYSAPGWISHSKVYRKAVTS